MLASAKQSAAHLYETHKGKSRKAFAQEVVTYPLSSVLFGMLDGHHQSIDDGVKTMRPESLAKALRL
jgi:hypothetical protein